MGALRSTVLFVALFADYSSAQEMTKNRNEVRGVARVVEAAREDACGQLWLRVRALPWGSGLDIGTMLARDAKAEDLLRDWVFSQPISGMPRVFPDGVVHVDVALSLPHLCLRLRQLANTEAIGGLPAAGWQGTLSLADGEEIVAPGVARGGSANTEVKSAERRASAIDAAKSLVAARIVRLMENVKLSQTRVLAQALLEKPDKRWQLQRMILPLISFDAPKESSGIITVVGNVALRDFADDLLTLFADGNEKITTREFLQLNGGSAFSAVEQAVIPATGSHSQIDAAAFRWGRQLVKTEGRAEATSYANTDDYLANPEPLQSESRNTKLRTWSRFLRGVMPPIAAAPIAKPETTESKITNNEQLELDDALLVEIAKSAARDELALQIRTLPAAYDATVGDLMNQDDAIARTVALMLEETQFSSPAFCEDGGVEIRAELPLARLAEVLLWFESYQRAMRGTGG